MHVEKKLQQNYWQSTVPLPVSSIGRTNRKYLIGIHCILLLLLASVIEIVLCVTLLTKRKLPILWHKTFFQWVNKFIQHSYGTNNVKSDHKYSVILMLINYTFVLYFQCLKILSTEEVSEAGDKIKKFKK